MEASQAAIDLIKRFEGCRLSAYPDPGTGAEPYTIGYGHTGGVQLGDELTQEQAEDFLRRDACLVAEEVTAALGDHPVTQSQFDALVSFTFNLGIHNLRASTLLRKLLAGDSAGAAAEFPHWDRAAGRVLPGLLKRRLAEQQLFTTETT